MPRSRPSFEAPVAAPVRGGDETLQLSDRLARFADIAVATRRTLVEGGWEAGHAATLIVTWFEHDSTYEGQA